MLHKKGAFANIAKIFLQCASLARLREESWCSFSLKTGLFIVVEMPLALLWEASWGSFLSSHPAVNRPHLRAPRGPCRGRCVTMQPQSTALPLDANSSFSASVFCCTPTDETRTHTHKCGCGWLTCFTAVTGRVFAWRAAGLRLDLEPWF